MTQTSNNRKSISLSTVNLNANSQWDFLAWSVSHQWLHFSSREWSVTSRPTKAKCLMSTVLSPCISRRADCTPITWHIALTHFRISSSALVALRNSYFMFVFYSVQNVWNNEADFEVHQSYFYAMKWRVCSSHCGLWYQNTWKYLKM